MVVHSLFLSLKHLFVGKAQTLICDRSAVAVAERREQMLHQSIIGVGVDPHAPDPHPCFLLSKHEEESTQTPAQRLVGNTKAMDGEVSAHALREPNTTLQVVVGTLAIVGQRTIRHNPTLVAYHSAVAVRHIRLNTLAIGVAILPLVDARLPQAPLCRAHNLHNALHIFHTRPPKAIFSLRCHLPSSWGFHKGSDFLGIDNYQYIK